MTKFLKAITWARWKYFDPYEPKYFTVFTASVMKPSFEYPVACVSLSVSNGCGKVFCRFASLVDLRKCLVVPDEYIERLNEGYAQAVAESQAIAAKQQTLFRISNLQPGSQVVRTDTGEIVAEAERIIEGR